MSKKLAKCERTLRTLVYYVIGCSIGFEFKQSTLKQLSKKISFCDFLINQINRLVFRRDPNAYAFILPSSLIKLINGSS